LLTEKTKLVAVNHVSNSLGTVNPIEEIIQIAHAANVPVLVDAAQAVQHLPRDVHS
jgi:cysteine desulfurase/selenocysteine lyase